VWGEGLFHTLFMDSMLECVGVSVGYVEVSVSVLIKISNSKVYFVSMSLRNSLTDKIGFFS